MLAFRRAVVASLRTPLLRSCSTQALQEPVDVQEQRNGAVVATLNRPKALNALDLEMVRLLAPHYERWSGDEAVKLAVLQGGGEKAFCAGGDIVSIYRSGKEGTALCKEFFREEYELDYRIATLPFPHLSLIQGVTMGGGLGLSVHGTYRVATDNSLCAMPETGIGFFCDVGGSHFLPRLPNNLGLYMALTGARVKGADVFHSGIATHYVPHYKWASFKKDLLNKDPETVEQILDLYSVTKTDKSAIEWEFCDKHFGAKSLSDLFASLEADKSEQAQACLKTLGRVSPLSVAVVFRQLQEGTNKSLKECLEMEYRISQAFMAGTDFFEGVRALLVDKDKNPKWQPARYEDVTEEMVESFFTYDVGDQGLRL